VVRSRLWSVADAGRLAASDLGGHALRAAISPSRDIRVGLEDTTVLDVEGLAGSLKAGGLEAPAIRHGLREGFAGTSRCGRSSVTGCGDLVERDVASMRRVLDGLISGNSLLSGSQRQQMDDNCLGWDCSVAGQADYRGKEGDIGDGSPGLHIFFGILAGTIPAVVAINSNLTEGEGISAIVQTALFAATSPP